MLQHVDERARLARHQAAPDKHGPGRNRRHLPIRQHAPKRSGTDVGLGKTVRGGNDAGADLRPRVLAFRRGIMGEIIAWLVRRKAGNKG